MTFQDLVEDLLDSHEITRTELNTRNARRAILEAYRWLSNAADWTCYRQRIVIQTVASYSTGTVVYDHTGGSYERMLTLTTGTWPSWSAFGRVVIDSVHYTVATRESDTVITLSANSNPGADVASTTYEIYRSTYPLPVDFKRLNKIWDVVNEREIPVVQDVIQQETSLTLYKSPGQPMQVAIQGDQEYYGSLSLVFSPPPDTIRTYDLLYTRHPRALKIDKYSTGTVTISGSATSVTGNSTSFPEDCVGSILRLTTSTTSEPTDVAGDSANVDNRYYAQRAITARASATALTIDATVSTSALTTVKYVISDPIDIEYYSMYGALRALASAEYSRLARRPKDYEMMFPVAQREVRMALEGDIRAPYSVPVVPYDPFVRTSTTDSS